MIHHEFSLIVSLLILLIDGSAGDKENFELPRTINQLCLADKSLVVAANGFWGLFSWEGNLQWQKNSTASKNFIVLSANTVGNFTSCYPNSLQLKCESCKVSSRTCSQERSRPLTDIGFLFDDKTQLFITRNATSSSSFIGVYRMDMDVENIVLTGRLKNGCECNIVAVMKKEKKESRGEAVFALSKVKTKDSKGERLVILRVDKRSNRNEVELYGNNITIADKDLGEPKNFILEPRNLTYLYFFTNQNRIGKVALKKNNQGPPGDCFEGTSKMQVFMGKEAGLQEVKGVNDALSGDSITSGIITYSPRLLFIGTAQGRIYKFTMDDNTGVMLKYNVTLSKKKPARIQLRVNFKDYLYGYIQHDDQKDEIFKIGVHDCKDHGTCSSCLGPNADPFCDWFPAENRCRPDEQPTINGKNESHCPRIQSVSPSAVPFEQQDKVNVTLENVPLESMKDATFLCRWYLSNTIHKNVSATILNKTTLVCKSPLFNRGSIAESVNLLIFANGNALVKDFSVKVYNCGIFRSCTGCQKPHDLEGTPFRCLWNSSNKKCAITHEAHKAKCPYLKQPKEEIRVPNRLPWNITLTGSGLEELRKLNFACSIDSKRYAFDVISNEKAICTILGDVGFNLTQFTRSANVILSSKANEEVKTDKGKPLTVTIYECSFAPNCTSCLMREDEGFLCKTVSNRPGDWNCVTGSRGQPARPPFCGHKPIVEKVFPKSGPLEGGTVVRISGQWLGINEKDLEKNVSIVDVPCSRLRILEPLRSIECTTGESKRSLTGRVKIYDTSSQMHSFEYKILQPPVNVSSPFCFTDYPKTFKSTLQNFDMGTKRTLTVAGIDVTNNTRRNGSNSDVYVTQCPRGVTKHKGKVVVTVDRSEKTSEEDFEFVLAPRLNSSELKKKSLKSIMSGGVTLEFPALNARLLDSIRINFLSSSFDASSDIRNCNGSETAVFCRSPKSQDGKPSEVQLETVPEVNFTRGEKLQVTFVKDPKFVDLDKDTLTIKKNSDIVLEAQKDNDLLDGVSKRDYKVYLNEKICDVTNVVAKLLTCSANSLTEEDRKQPIEIKVHIGLSLIQNLGKVTLKGSDNSLKIVWPVLGLLLFCILVAIAATFWYKKRRDRKQLAEQLTMERYMEEEHFAAANASRNAFIAMQTAIQDMQLMDKNVELPFRDFEDFMIGVLLPNPSGKAAALAEFENYTKMTLQTVPNAELVQRFSSQLLSEKPFILTLIRTFDSSTKLADKSLIAAAISIVFADRMEFYYQVLRELFHHIVRTNIKERRTDSLTLLFRRSESLMEKMFSNWLTICLYNHLRTTDTGAKLYIVFQALNKFLHMGPVDAFRFRARNVLNEDVLLSEEIEFSVIAVTGSLQDDDMELDPVDLEILSCDSIGQVKEKIIEALFPHRPFTLRPSAEDFVLQWKRSTGAENSAFYPIETQLTSRTNRLPRIGDLNVKDALVGAQLVLMRLSQAGASTDKSESTSQQKPREDARATINGAGSLSSFVSDADDSTNLLARDSFGELEHLCQADTVASPTISKDFCLPHLLKTRHVVHTYIDDLFKFIFNIDVTEPPSLYVEHMFAVIDDAANEAPHDREMLAHVWKSNSFVLRVWVNLLKNPEFLFDINKSPLVNSSLSVVAQALMDACSQNRTPATGKGLSSTKLVFLRDIEKYQNWVSEFYAKLGTKKTLPSDQEMSTLYSGMQSTCNFSEDIVFRATRFLFMKSRDIKGKIIEAIGASQWFHTNEERQSFVDRVEALLGSTYSDTVV